MVAGWRWPWLVVMAVGAAIVLGAALRLFGIGPEWTLAEMDQGASVLSLLVGIAGLAIGLTQRQATAPNLAAGGEAGPPALGADLLAGLPRLGEQAERHLAVEVLGVHRAIPVPAAVADANGLDPDLPNWVERTQAGAVRERLAAAKLEGGFLILSGDSSVGKTRLLYQTASEVLEGWPVLASAARGDARVFNELADRASELTEGVVVWLDELHRYLPGPYAGSVPLEPATITRLRDAPAPVVIVGALWPEHLTTLRATRTRQDGTFEALYPDAADMLRDVPITPLSGFDDDETAAARAAGADDPRLAEATATPHARVTQALAGGPSLIERYENARGVHRALLLAAVDAQRLGVRPPLPAALLTAAARGYLTDAHPTDDWAQPALDDLGAGGGPDHRANALLIAHHNATRYQTVGYEVTDYLLQHAARARRTTPIPDPAWAAFINHTNNPADLTHLADRARRRGLDSHATTALTKAADAGDTEAARELVVVLAERGDIDALTARADAGDTEAAWWLVVVLAERGDIDALTARADAGDTEAARELVVVLAERGDIDALTARADAGDTEAARELVVVLAARGDIDALTARADAGDTEAAWRLADLLAARGDIDALTARADAGDTEAARRLADVLAARGDIDALTARADVGDPWAARRLPARGDIDALTTYVAAADTWAARRLIVVLAERGDIDALIARADVGDPWAARRLADVLAERGDIDALIARADAGDTEAARRLVVVLAERGDIDALTARADAGDTEAARQLADMLAERGDIGRLRDEVDAGTEGAIELLRRLTHPEPQ